MILESLLEYLALMMRLNIFVSELKGMLQYDSKKHIVCCGISVAPRDGGIVPVNVHVSAMDVNAKGSD